jgi:hypothetical protein
VAQAERGVAAAAAASARECAARLVKSERVVCSVSEGCWPERHGQRSHAWQKVGGGWLQSLRTRAGWYRRLEERSGERDLPMSSSTTSEALQRARWRDAADMLWLFVELPAVKSGEGREF